ncbi:hypothetical protein QBC43DRAFT_291885 [Cladorrhinum sp. PSN259]|nr:hypothetical protein QBC43DRAFT_291885 [Cladorrhinum sp. PSN259]
MPFQNIAPAPRASPDSNEGSSSSPTAHITTNLPKRRDVVRKACIPCRTKKIKCSSGQPCRQCISRDKAPADCIYALAPEESLRLDNERLEKLVRELQERLAEVQSRAIDIAHLSTLEPVSPQPFADLLPSEHDGYGSLVFPTRTTHPLFLSTASPSPASTGSGIDLPQTVSPNLLLSSSTKPPPSVLPLLSTSLSRLDREVMLLPLPQNSLAYELSIRYPSVCPALTPPDGELLGLQVLFDATLVESQIDLIHSMKPPAIGLGMRLCDQRLGGLELFDRWTNVAIDHGLAAELISRYLETDHPILGPFDADLFLNDLVTSGTDYCSPLLVSAILSWACQAYADQYPDLHLQDFAVLFNSEAQHLFWQPENLHHITSVSAAVFLEVCANSSGRIEEGAKYKAAGLAISEELGLLGGLVPVEQQEQLWTTFTTDQLRARSHAAWGLFALRIHFDLLHCSCSVPGPPSVPLLGRDTYTGADGLPKSLLYPLHVGPSFVADHELAVLIHEATKKMYGDTGNRKQHILSLEQVESLFRRFLAWSSAIPLECARGDRNTPAILRMHMHFHGAVIALFQPFVSGPLQRLRLQTFITKGSVMCTFNSSVDQLKRLVMIYRRTFEKQAHDTYLIMFGPLILASVLCQLGPSKERNDVLERRHYFAVCVGGMLNWLSRFSVMKTIILGLISVGLSTQTITTEYAKTVMAEVSQRRGWQDLLGDESPGTCEVVVDFQLALIDRLSATAGKASEKLRDINDLIRDESPSKITTMSGGDGEMC